MALGMAAAIGLLSGCAPDQHATIRTTQVGITPGLLFNRVRLPVAATDIGRDEWPATISHLPDVEETHYIESFEDVQGRASNERSYPRRRFHSYRVGSQYR
ncbi:MAG: hypothetical protein ACE5F9_10315 [Phycisphaerae bacterium]